MTDTVQIPTANDEELWTTADDTFGGGNMPFICPVDQATECTQAIIDGMWDELSCFLRSDWILIDADCIAKVRDLAARAGRNIDNLGNLGADDLVDKPGDLGTALTDSVKDIIDTTADEIDLLDSKAIGGLDAHTLTQAALIQHAAFDAVSPKIFAGLKNIKKETAA
jgi:hypothetical protein